MKKLILALHSGHNSSACIGHDSGIAFAIQEERLTREKNYWGFPYRSIQACMDYMKILPKDLSVIAYGGKQVFCRYHDRNEVLKGYQKQETFLGRLRQRVLMPLLVTSRPQYGQSQLRLLLDKIGLGEVPIVYYDHHLSHAAAAYYGLRTNPFEKYLVLTCDGAGDGVCATARLMVNGEYFEIATTQWENSLGAIYSWVTYILGFVPLEHEYKLMGMAPYASEEAAKEVADILHSYLGLDKGGLQFERRVSIRTNDLVGRISKDLKRRRFDHICGGLQKFTEDLLCQWVRNLVSLTGVHKILAAGGVFMNVKANQKIAELEEVESFEAFPSCGDETLPFGAYYLEAAKRYGEISVSPLRDLYLGPELQDEEILNALQQTGFYYEYSENIALRVAGLLSAGHPVARCAGRLEFGARALGNRSILADPINLDMVRRINQMVKKRDFWLPFAPVVTQEHAAYYLQNPKHLRSPFMTMTFPTTENRADFMAAIHPGDLTCRAQILSREQNPDLYEVLTAFKKLTCRAVLLNTSFNLHGSPIVCTVRDALEVFRGSGLEYLQLGHWIISKKKDILRHPEQFHETFSERPLSAEAERIL